MKVKVFFKEKNRNFFSKGIQVLNILKIMPNPVEICDKFATIWWNNNFKFRREGTADDGKNAIGKHWVKKRNQLRERFFFHVLYMPQNQKSLLRHFGSSFDVNAAKLYFTRPSQVFSTNVQTIQHHEFFLCHKCNATQSSRSIANPFDHTNIQIWFYCTDDALGKTKRGTNDFSALMATREKCFPRYYSTPKPAYYFSTAYLRLSWFIGNLFADVSVKQLLFFSITTQNVYLNWGITALLFCSGERCSERCRYDVRNRTLRVVEESKGQPKKTQPQFESD